MAEAQAPPPRILSHGLAAPAKEREPDTFLLARTTGDGRLRPAGRVSYGLGPADREALRTALARGRARLTSGYAPVPLTGQDCRLASDAVLVQRERELEAATNGDPMYRAQRSARAHELLVLSQKFNVAASERGFRRSVRSRVVIPPPNYSPATLIRYNCRHPDGDGEGE